MKKLVKCNLFVNKFNFKTDEFDYEGEQKHKILGNIVM